MKARWIAIGIGAVVCTGAAVVVVSGDAVSDASSSTSRSHAKGAAGPGAAPASSDAAPADGRSMFGGADPGIASAGPNGNVFDTPGGSAPTARRAEPPPLERALRPGTPPQAVGGASTSGATHLPPAPGTPNNPGNPNGAGQKGAEWARVEADRRAREQELLRARNAQGGVPGLNILQQTSSPALGSAGTTATGIAGGVPGSTGTGAGAGSTGTGTSSGSTGTGTGSGTGTSSGSTTPIGAGSGSGSIGGITTGTPINATTRWVPVDSSACALLKGFRTADLYLRFDSAVSVLTVDSGVSGNTGISVTGGTFINNPANTVNGGNAAPLSTADACARLDSYLALNNADITFAGAAPAFGSTLKAAWFTVGGATAAQNQAKFGDTGYYVLIGQFTVPTTTTNLSGEVSIVASAAGATLPQNLLVPVTFCSTCFVGEAPANGGANPFSSSGTGTGGGTTTGGTGTGTGSTGTGTGTGTGSTGTGSGSTGTGTGSGTTGTGTGSGSTGTGTGSGSTGTGTGSGDTGTGTGSGSTGTGTGSGSTGTGAGSGSTGTGTGSGGTGTGTGSGSGNTSNLTAVWISVDNQSCAETDVHPAVNLAGYTTRDLYLRLDASTYKLLLCATGYGTTASMHFSAPLWNFPSAFGGADYNNYDTSDPDNPPPNCLQFDSFFAIGAKQPSFVKPSGIPFDPNNPDPALVWYSINGDNAVQNSTAFGDGAYYIRVMRVTLPTGASVVAGSSLEADVVMPGEISTQAVTVAIPAFPS